MQIDCRNLACPEPVLKTKKALDDLADDSLLEVLVSSESSLENVIRFANSNGYTTQSEDLDKYTKITIVKGFHCFTNETKKSENFVNKVVFLKSDRVGDGDLGETLMRGFLKSILELPTLPKKLICVNSAVLLTTQSEDSETIKTLKELEKKGVEIYSCGVCLSYYKKENELKVGVVGNAYDTVHSLINSEGTISF